jgi:hypothetical protein
VNEIGVAYRQWERCRDEWFATVSDAGFVLGLHPPDEWEDLMNCDYPPDLILSTPDRAADFRKELRAHGFE